MRTLFEELSDSRVREVVIKRGARTARVESWGTGGSHRRRRLPLLLFPGVLGKMKKLARLDIAELRRTQCGRVRLLNFHGGPMDFEVTTGRAGKYEVLILRRL